MSLEGLLKELDRTRRDEQDKMISLMKEQFEAMLRAKDQEIASLRDEITTLRNWLDHSALPAANPISKRSESMGLIKMNFGSDKSCPEMYSPGEKEMLESLRRKEPWPEISGAGFSDAHAALSSEPLSHELPDMPHAPFPEREPEKDAADTPGEHLVDAVRFSDAEAPLHAVPSTADKQGFDEEALLPRPVMPGDEPPAVKRKPARPRKRKASSAKKPSKRK